MVKYELNLIIEHDTPFTTEKIDELIEMIDSRLDGYFETKLLFSDLNMKV